MIYFNDNDNDFVRFQNSLTLGYPKECCTTKFISPSAVFPNLHKKSVCMSYKVFKIFINTSDCMPVCMSEIGLIKCKTW